MKLNLNHTHNSHHFKTNRIIFLLNIFAVYLILMVANVKNVSAQQSQSGFALGDSVFLLNGKPFQIISGEMHYTRVPREAWKSRMLAAKAMGLNTISTYVFWNTHEPQKGQFDFSGNNDIVEFVKLAKQVGLWVILRPSPYVCAEWEFGGYPYWLQNEDGLVVRSKESKYLQAYKSYIDEIGKKLAPLQINHGGNILMVQVENEYGLYGNDKDYLSVNVKMFRKAGFDGVLYTCDPPGNIANGHLDGLLPAVNGTDRPEQVKRVIRNNHNGKGPYFISEWYPAWFDWWGAPHHTVPSARYAPRLDSVLAAGLSINMYMFHGGTTRGFMNGANLNDNSPYEPQVNSYGYDAPLDEAGNPTPKYMAFRKVIEKYLPAGQKLPPVPASKPSMVIPPIALGQSVRMLDMLPKPSSGLIPLTFEDLKQDYGFVLYRTQIQKHSGVLKLEGLRDYAIVMIDGKKVGVLDRRLKQDSLTITTDKPTSTLDILVENLGRINFGKYLLKNKKGITGRVLLNGNEVKNWQMYSLPFNHIENIKFGQKPVVAGSPVLKKGTFILNKLQDTYLNMSNWGKGVVWVNGHNLGRYWSIGPQQTLYLPAEWLKEGKNEIVVLELLNPALNIITTDKPILNLLQQSALINK